jgi:hypothetical protein
MNKVVLIKVNGGIVETVDLPEGVTVIVHDYDDGETETNADLVFTDDEGKYVEYVFERPQFLGTVQAYHKTDESKQTELLFLTVEADDEKEAAEIVRSHFGSESDFVLVQVVSVVRKP